MVPSKNSQKVSENLLSRRSFLKLTVFAAGAGLFPGSALAALGDVLSPEKTLSFYNIHTQERLHSIYWRQGNYVPEALAEIHYILRDHRTGEMNAIDTRLLDLLHSIASRIQSPNPFHIISGYRSPSTNALLNRQSTAVARNSLHLHGKAVDISLPGCELASLRQIAMELRGGGVGYYPRDNFVHLDVGRVRYW